MKTLYVSDLDGTLLRSDETTSDFTNETINRLVSQGMLFSYATARSYTTAHKVTCGLEARIPLIVYNGTMTVDNTDGKILLQDFFDQSRIRQVLDDLAEHGVFPIVYGFVDGKEKFSYAESLCSKGAREFVATRPNDPRQNPVDDADSLYKGEIFYMTCIDDEAVLAPLYEKYRDEFHCVFARDFYSGEFWLEFLPPQVSKANAVRRLKAHLGCERLVVFGDGSNDIDMFELADECYAVENAVEQLKKMATGIIGDNNSDAVAKWLLENFRPER